MALFVSINFYLVQIKFVNNNQRFISPYPTPDLLIINKLFFSVSVYIIHDSSQQRTIIIVKDTLNSQTKV